VGLLDKIINTVYPPKCIFCRKTLEHDAVLNICGECYPKLPFSQEILLPVQEGGENGGCDGAVSVFQYTGMAKESLIRFKFCNTPSYYRTYAGLLAQRIKRMTDVRQYDMVMSVPLHKQREFARGFNQAYLLSRALSRELKRPEGSGLLKRERHTNAQSLLNRKDRQENIKGAFSVVSPQKIKGKSILLVDDILTTGSTLEECGSTLRKAGAVKVTAAVVATGRKY
jgi:ComF family protein